MIKIGITGQYGFIGTHLYNSLGLFPEKYHRIPFPENSFKNENVLLDFIEQCDVIVHLAAINRHLDAQTLYDQNISLVSKLVNSLNKTNSKAHILFSSSTQEEQDNIYGKSKKEGRLQFQKWAEISGGTFAGLIIPNVFGAFGKPFYNSFIATFCHQLTHNELPQVINDSEVSLIYVGDLVKEIIQKIDNQKNEVYKVPSNINIKVSEILAKLNYFKLVYFDKGEIPKLESKFELNLFNTFRSYIDLNTYFPKKYTQHSDNRGTFTELVRLGIGGQVSYSTTHPHITRGNHFHTRKIERFSVIQGKALIQLRQINTNIVNDFYLDGNVPAFVDMPIWVTHNIKNIGQVELLTVFWINELYNPDDPDTFFETV